MDAITVVMSDIRAFYTTVLGVLLLQQNAMTKKQVGFLHFQIIVLPWKKSELKPKRGWNTEGCCLLDCFPLVSLPGFLKNSELPALG